MLWHYKWYFGNYSDEWYKTLFNYAGECRVRGEITPSYMVIDEEDIKSMYRINPETKIIFIIRDPVERAWATIKYTAKYAGYYLNIKDDQEVIKKLSSMEYVMHGDYISAIKRYMSIFPADQFLVCFYDAIKDRPDLLIRNINTFVGADQNKGNYSELNRKINSSSNERMSDVVYKYLLDMYGEQIEKLQKLFGGYTMTWGKNKENKVQKDWPVSVILKGELINDI